MKREVYISYFKVYSKTKVNYHVSKKYVGKSHVVDLSERKKGKGNKGKESFKRERTKCEIERKINGSKSISTHF